MELKLKTSVGEMIGLNGGQGSKWKFPDWINILVQNFSFFICKKKTTLTCLEGLLCRGKMRMLVQNSIHSPPKMLDPFPGKDNDGSGECGLAWTEFRNQQTPRGDHELIITHNQQW